MIAELSRQTGADRIRCDIERLVLQGFVTPHRVVVIATLPEWSVGADESAAARFHHLHRRGKGSRAQFHQPMYVIRHDRPGQVEGSALLLNPLQARYNDGGLVWLSKVPMALVSDRGDRVDVPQLRPTAFQ